jgi:hypothetical protein
MTELGVGRIVEASRVDETSFGDRVGRELLLALLCGAATFLGIRVAQRLEDPYSEPRLSLSTWLDQHRGGDPA